MSYFDAYGPFPVPRGDGAYVGQQAAFWRGIEARWPGVTRAIGCYVFCLEHRGVIRPWYVGRTWAGTGFSGEVFEPHKRDIYSEIMRSRRGDPMIFLFPLITPTEYRFSQARKSSRKVITWLEITLMGFAHRKNPNISNVRDMAFLRNVEVLGLLGKRRPGRPFREAQAVRRALLASSNVARPSA